jgi:hypothetical protein
VENEGARLALSQVLGARLGIQVNPSDPGAKVQISAEGTTRRQSIGSCSKWGVQEELWQKLNTVSNRLSANMKREYSGELKAMAGTIWTRRMVVEAAAVKERKNRPTGKPPSVRL